MKNAEVKDIQKYIRTYNYKIVRCINNKYIANTHADLHIDGFSRLYCNVASG